MIDQLVDSVSFIEYTMAGKPWETRRKTWVTGQVTGDTEGGIPGNGEDSLTLPIAN